MSDTRDDDAARLYVLVQRLARAHHDYSAHPEGTALLRLAGAVDRYLVVNDAYEVLDPTRATRDTIDAVRDERESAGRDLRAAVAP